MLNKSRDIQKIGIWLFLPAFVLVAIVLPASGPPAVLGETVALIVNLEIAIVLSLLPDRRLLPAFHFAIHPRSPPIY